MADILKVLIVDGEKLARERRVRMVGALDYYEVAGDATFGEHAVDAYKVNAASHLLKPVCRDALQETPSRVHRARKVQVAQIKRGDQSRKIRTHISAKTRQGIELVSLDDVCLFQADHRYVNARHNYNMPGENL